MINTGYRKYISEEKQDAIYTSMVRDIYYFYHGMKTNENMYIGGGGGGGGGGGEPEAANGALGGGFSSW